MHSFAIAAVCGRCAANIAVGIDAVRTRGNVPEHFDLRNEVYRISGVDLTKVDALAHVPWDQRADAQTILAEIGADMSPWETEVRFVSWLNLAPNNRISGGTVIGRTVQERRCLCSAETCVRGRRLLSMVKALR
ncbi:MAG: transposase [Bryobacteraceae bacterium]